MTMHERVSGTWKEITGAHVNVSGTWKEITEGYERVGGVWKQFFSSSVLLNPGSQNYSHVNPGALATSGVRIATDRDVDERQASNYLDRDDWLEATGTASDYEVRATVNSGS